LRVHQVDLSVAPSCAGVPGGNHKEMAIMRRQMLWRSGGVAVMAVLPAFAAAQAGSWAVRAPMPTPREHAAAAAIGDTIFVFGGLARNDCTGLRTAEAYDTISDQWSARAPMPTGRWNAGVAVVNGIIYVMGGSVGCGPRTAAVEAYDPVTDTWTTRAPLPSARAGVAVSAIGNLIYAVGGVLPFAEGIVDRVDVFDPAANIWSAGPAMLLPRTDTAVAVLDGVLYVAAGCCAPEAGSRLESFDPVAGQWTVRAPLLQPRVFGPGGAALNGRFYVAGGNAGEPLHETEAYDPVSGTWSFVAPMPTARTEVAAAVANGRFYAIGGDLTGEDHATGANEAFEPEAAPPPDTTPPFATLRLSPGVLWPPDHRLVPVTAELEASDDGGVVTVEGPFVTSSEPVDATGDGDTAPDWVVDSTYQIRVRAERSGPHRGRVYTLTYVVRDQAGNSVTVNATISVPHGGPR
jgi:hypothetical protein